MDIQESKIPVPINNGQGKQLPMIRDSYSDFGYVILNKSLFNDSRAQNIFCGKYFFSAHAEVVNTSKSASKFRWIADAYPCGNIVITHYCSAWRTADVYEAKFICQALNHDCPEYEWVVLQYAKIEEYKEI
jgi:hypothetical protein